MLKLPPFGTYLHYFYSNNLPMPKNSVYIFIGHKASRKAENFQISRPGAMCLPPYECPSTYFWPVKDCDILIFDTGWPDQNYLDDLVCCLYQYDALVVRSISPEFKLTIHDK